MATNKYLALVSGKVKEVFASLTGTANAIPAGDSTGRLDPSWLPVGVGQELIIVPSSENLTAGSFVNLYSNAGVLNARNSDATTNAKPAHGFVTANVTSPANASVFFLGITNSAALGLVIGTKYVISKTVPGGVTDIAVFSAAQATGNIVQEVGIASKITEILTTPNVNYIEVA